MNDIEGEVVLPMEEVGDSKILDEVVVVEV
jgi:hypothetical protein